MSTIQNNTPEQGSEKLAYSIPTFCPVDGTIMTRQYLAEWECECWVCSMCGFIDPIL